MSDNEVLGSIEDAPDDSRFNQANDPVFEQLGICHTCTHKRGAITCTAFPDGIPTIVLVGKHLHTRPFPGDHGVLYAPEVV